jgi:hypothetical protein
MVLNRGRWFCNIVALTSVPALVAAHEALQGTARIVPSAPDRLTLELKGLTPAFVEVEIGGVSVVQRPLSGRASPLQIPLSSAGLPPGTHEATVRLYDAQGRLLTTLRGPVELSPDPTAPITILIPRHGTTVSGVVPIEVRVRGQERPYVSFFVDGQVRTLRNYPPYVYYWDTSRERNGWHTLEAWSFDGSQTFKSPATRVFVNNPGGRTERVAPPQSDEQVGLNEPTLAAPATPTAHPEWRWRGMDAIEGQMRVEGRLSQPRQQPAPAPEAPPPVSVPAVSRPAPTEAHRATMPVRVPAPAYRVARAETQPSRAERLSPPPAESAPPAETVLSTVPTLGAKHLRVSGTAPQMRGQKLSVPQIALAPATAASAPRATTRAKGSHEGLPLHSAWLPITFGTRLPAPIARYEVLLDARPVSFDVAPRVQDGISIVAIRPIVEQAGGTLRWDNLRKVATIELMGRMLTLDVRANRALLEGEPVQTEIPLQIVNGRVMVPASLLGTLLNAELAFEVATHRLHINTR